MKVYLKDGQIATKNLTPGISVYGEELIQEKEEYRIWNPRRSKLAAALLNGLENLDISEDAKVLYLGASTGTTISHISDIVTDGRIYAVEFSPTTAKKLVRLARQRTNIAPILGDATKPKNYLNITEQSCRSSPSSPLFPKGALSFWQTPSLSRLSTTINVCFTASTSKANTTPKPGMTSWSLSSFSAPSAFRSLPRSTVVR